MDDAQKNLVEFLRNKRETEYRQPSREFSPTEFLNALTLCRWGWALTWLREYPEEVLATPRVSLLVNSGFLENLGNPNQLESAAELLEAFTQAGLKWNEGLQPGSKRPAWAWGKEPDARMEALLEKAAAQGPVSWDWGDEGHFLAHLAQDQGALHHFSQNLSYQKFPNLYNERGIQLIMKHARQTSDGGAGPQHQAQQLDRATGAWHGIYCLRQAGVPRGILSDAMQNERYSNTQLILLACKSGLLPGEKNIAAGLMSLLHTLEENKDGDPQAAKALRELALYANPEQFNHPEQVIRAGGEALMILQEAGMSLDPKEHQELITKISTERPGDRRLREIHLHLCLGQERGKNTARKSGP